MQKLKECKDKLEAVGVFIEDEELLHIIQDGLPTEFYPFCSAMRTRNEPISFEELLVLMLAEEKSLKQNSDSSKESMHLAMLGVGPKPNTSTNTSTAVPFNPQSNRGAEVEDTTII
ncbi:cytokinin riboside 5'-monophosphate phosphoribohydrolase log1 [Fagus crenata]